MPHLATPKPEPSSPIPRPPDPLNPLQPSVHQAKASGSAFDYYNLALAHSQQGNLESIAAPLEEALSRLPTFADAWINIGVYYQATARPQM